MALLLLLLTSSLHMQQALDVVKQCFHTGVRNESEGLKIQRACQIEVNTQSGASTWM